MKSQGSLFFLSNAFRELIKLFLHSLDISADNYFNDGSPKDRDNVFVYERDGNNQIVRLVRLPTVLAANRHFL